MSLTLHGTGLSIADVDAASGSVQGTLSVVFGTLTVTAGTTGVAVLGSGSNSVTLTGTVAQINNLLAGNLGATASYLINGDTPPATDTLTLLINDQGNTGSGGAQSGSANSTINITAVNDAPTANVPASYSATEQVSLTLHGTGLSIADADAASGSVQATLSVVSGSLTITAGTTGVTVLGSGSSSVTLTGTVAQINDLLAGNVGATASYVISSDAPPATDSLTLLINDQGNTGSGGAQSGSANSTINLTAVNDAPVNSVPGPQLTSENTSLVFSGAGGNQISVSDPDAGGNPLQVTLTAVNGTFSLNATAGLSFSLGDGTSDATMTFTGSLVDINAALDGMSFTPPTSYNGPASLQILVDDQGHTGIGGALSDTDTVSITVSAINDGPVNAVPGAQSTNEDTPLVFSLAAGNSLSVGDIDAGSNPLQITLTVTNGTLTLAGTTGLAFMAGDGAADATMIFSGSLAEINAALDGLSFAPTANYNGAASLQMISNDQGFSGGAPLSDADTVNITVNAVNDAPALSLPGVQSPVSMTIVFSSATGNAITIGDLDAAGMPLRVALNAINGTLTLSSTAGLVLLTGSGVGDAQVEFVGDAASINAALEGLRLELGMDPGGSTLSVTVDDQGAAGQGGPQSASGMVAVQQIPLIPPPAPSDSDSQDSDSDSDSEADSDSSVVPGAIEPMPAGQDGSGGVIDQSADDRGSSRPAGGGQLPQAVILPGPEETEEEDSFFGQESHTAGGWMDRLMGASGVSTIVSRRDLASLDVTLLWSQLDALADDIVPNEMLSTFSVGAAAGVSAVFSAGYVAWCLRSGAAGQCHFLASHVAVLRPAPRPRVLGKARPPPRPQREGPGGRVRRGTRRGHGVGPGAQRKRPSRAGMTAFFRVEARGVEPLTSALRTLRSPN